MKKIIPLLLLLFTSYKGFTQVEKDRMMIGANFNINQSTTTAYLQDSLNMSIANINSNGSTMYGLNSGYFIKNNLMTGVGFRYNYNTHTSKLVTANGTYTTTSGYGNSFSVWVFARYYQMAYKNKLALFVNARLLYSDGNIFPNHNSLVRSYNRSYGLSLSPGFTYFVTNVIALETSFGYLNFMQQNSAVYNAGNQLTYKSDGFTVNASGLSLADLTFGLSFYFGKPIKAPEVK